MSEETTGAEMGADASGELDLAHRDSDEASASAWSGAVDTEPYDPLKAREDMRARIAIYLVLLLCFVVAAAFVTVWVAGDLTEDIKDLLTLVLGPIAALVGSATGYYFGGREREAKKDR